MTIDILVLASNPQGTEPLLLNAEIRAIEKAHKSSEKRKEFTVEYKPAVRISELQEIILEKKTRIIHFCGHGNGHKGLILENDNEEIQLVSTEALRDLFKIFNRQIECVVLNACQTRFQGEQIKQHINFLVATQKDIRDDAALLFAKGFYEALFNGETYRNAYKMGCNRIQLELNDGKNLGRKLVPVYDKSQGSYINLEQHEILLFFEKDPPNEIISNNTYSNNLKHYNYQYKIKGEFQLPEPFASRAKLENFTGREAELNKLETLIVEKQHLHSGTNIVVISGMPGVGKSALACFFATHFYYKKKQFCDGVYGLRVDNDKEDTQAIAHKIADHFGVSISEKDGRNATDIMQKAFASSQALLIFDNAKSTDIFDLVPKNAQCAVIVTTQLGILANYANVPSIRHIELRELETEDSLKLFKRIVGEDRIEREKDTARYILNYVGFLPLAIHIIGATLKTKLYKNDKHALTRYAENLENEKLTLLKRHENEYLNIVSTFSLSIDSLPEKIQKFFACLGACAESSFSLKTAIAVGNISPSKADSYIGQLLDYSLLNLIEANRFNFHTLIRKFAIFKLKEFELLAETRERHANYFLTYIQTQYRNNQLEDGDVLNYLDKNIEDIIIAAELLAESAENRSDFYDFIVPLKNLFEQYYHWHKAIKLIEIYIKHANPNNELSTIIELKCLKVELLLLEQKYSLAKDILNEIENLIISIKQENNKQDCEALWLISYSSYFQRNNENTKAKEKLLRSLELSKKLKDEELQSRILNKLGAVLQRIGRNKKAKKYLIDSKEICQNNHYVRSLTKVLTTLAVVSRNLAEYEQALYYLKDSYSIARRELKDRRQVAIIQLNYGSVYEKMEPRDKSKAYRAYYKSYIIYKKLGDLKGQRSALRYWLRLLHQQGHTEKYICLAEKLNDSHNIAIVLNQLATELRDEGQIDKAIKILKQEVRILDNSTRFSQKIYAYNTLANILKEQKKYSLALNEVQESIKFSRQESRDLQLSISLKVEVEIKKAIIEEEFENKKYLVHEKYNEIENIYEEIISLERKIKNYDHLLLSYNALAKIKVQNTKASEAIRWQCKSIDLSLRIDNKLQLVIDLYKLASLLTNSDNISSIEKAKTYALCSIVLSNELEEDIKLHHRVCGLFTLADVLKANGSYHEATKILNKAVKESNDLESEEQHLIGLLKLHGIIQNQLNSIKDNFDLLCESSCVRDETLLQEDVCILKQAINDCEKLEDYTRLVQCIYFLYIAFKEQNKQEEITFFLDKNPDLYQRVDIEQKKQLARIYVALGAKLKDNYQAVERLKKAFSINKNICLLQNHFENFAKTMNSLYYAFEKIDGYEDANRYLHEALETAPNDPNLLELKEKSYKPLDIVIEGKIFPSFNPNDDKGFGFIYPSKPDEKIKKIYFSRRNIKKNIFSQLEPNMLVKVKLMSNNKGVGYVARSIKIIYSSRVWS